MPIRSTATRAPWRLRCARSPPREWPTCSSSLIRSPSRRSPRWNSGSPCSTPDGCYPRFVEDEQAPTPIGVTGRLTALPLTNAAGNHAVLVRQADASRALLTGEKGSGDRERLIVVPLDDDVEVRIDGDALAIWLTQG